MNILLRVLALLIYIFLIHPQVEKYCIKKISNHNYQIYFTFALVFTITYSLVTVGF
jgi:hypothetical protein